MQMPDIELLEQLAIHEARESFWSFRQYINRNGKKKLKLGWWQRLMAKELQQFYEDLIDGKRPKLVIEAPPQHGKSKMVVEFIAWVAGKNPDLKTIYTSFSERLGVRANLMLQRIYDGERYKKIFPDTRISTIGMSNSDTMGATRNREFMEYIGCDGSFRNTTVRGQITGEALDLGVIDDPIKGREEAGSKTIRDKTWDWLTDDFFSRFSDEAGMLSILTRWHIDDPIGRLRLLFGDNVKVVSFPAIATNDEKFRKKGEPLFPEHKSLPFLLERKGAMAAVNWEALYQQNPQIIGGEIIHGENFVRYTVLPIIKERCIYADTAQKTKERNDYSVFECWGKGDDGKIYLIDLIRGKWEAPELKRRAVAFWAKHKNISPQAVQLGQLRKMKVEDKSSGTGLIQDIKNDRLTPIPIEGIQRSIDKYTRVSDILGYIESGYVCIPADAPFTLDFITECESFTADDSHMFDDQIDPMCDAINDFLASNSVVSIWERQA